MAAPLVHEGIRAFRQKADLTVDIAVVFAGVSGVYSAWRLKQPNGVNEPDSSIS
jgi:hypothetical protein